MRLQRPAFVRAFALGVMLLTSACTAVPGAQPSETPPTGSVSLDPARCFDLLVQSSELLPTISNLRKNTTDTFVGVFGGYGEPRWNTPDGHRPTAEEFQEKPARLIRPISIEFQAAVRGPQEDASNAVARGGTLGCDTITYLGDPTLVEGQRYMFFMGPINDSEGKPSGDLLVTNAWPIEKDVVNTEQDGDLPLEAAIDAVKNGPKVTAPPSPGEPPETTTGP
jgi:hypothetical protein